MLFFREAGEMKDTDPASPKAQDLVKRIQDYITENVYTCSNKILRGLGKMYSGGGDFTKYNYFQTKEEIFMALFEREYDRWNEALIAIMEGYERLRKDELASKIAGSLAERVQLLKLLSMNNYDMEANSLINRPFENSGILEYCRKNNIHFFVYLV